jgi:hypothetical protein
MVHFQFFHPQFSSATRADTPLGVLIVKIIQFDHGFPGAFFEHLPSMVATDLVRPSLRASGVRKRSQSDVLLRSETT